MRDHDEATAERPDVVSTPDPDKLLTALSTEHFTLQGARSQTMTESAARASVYVFSLSSSLVALGFIGQLSEVGDVFLAFALAVLPTLYLLGVVTYVRMVECGAEDFRYGVAINRIRHYYKEIAGDRANLFLLSGYDDPASVFANMGIPAEGRKPWFAFSTAVIVIDSVVAGSAVALAIGGLLNVILGVSIAAGAATALISIGVWLWFGGRILARSAARSSPLYPAPVIEGDAPPGDADEGHR
jgi:hypothetical protein